MKAFRINNEEDKPPLSKQLILGTVVLVIVISFIWQVSLGLCPVP